MNFAIATKLIDLAITFGPQIAAGVMEARAKRDVLVRCVAEGREPTEAEWAELTAGTDALHDRVQRA